MIDKDAKILIVGHGEIIDNALKDHFQSHGYPHVFSTHQLGLNTTIQASVYEFFSQEKPDYVFLASTRSGGIKANQENGAEFIYHNLESQNNIVYASHKFGVKKLLFFAGSCSYPKHADQPIKEDVLLTGPLESTSEPYAVAKIAGIKLCQAYRQQYGFNAVVMVPATIYGPGSNVNLETAHVMGALIGKFVQAVRNKDKEVVVWGSGRPQREFLFVEDFVDACLFLMNHYDDGQLINTGYGEDISIKDLAELIADITGFDGHITYDASKPDGVMQKLLDSSRIKALGWQPKLSLREGIEKTVAWYQSTL